VTKPRTAPRGGKPHTAPEHQHAVLSQAEQAKFLGRSDEIVSNLGHPSREDDLTRHPLRKVPNYEPASNRVVDGPKRGVGVYRSFKNPQSGISTSEANLRGWASYAHSNSYDGGHGEGVEPKMPDPRERAAAGHRPGGGKDSDGHLLRPEWDRYQFGADSGEGRLEKTHRK
jgi:hypothetical protein